MLLKGGYTNYGQDIGILMLDTRFPRIPGDIGNARSYEGIPIRYKVVKNAHASKVMGKEPDAELLKPFIEAAQELEAEGVKAITTSCGFLAAFQRTLADSVNIPVFTSALMLAPLVHSMINKNKKIGIFTERAWNMDENHFLKCGWSSKDIPVCVTGMLEGSPFPALFIDEEQGGATNRTAIYHYDGWAYELFFEVGYEHSPRDGAAVVKNESLLLERLDNGLIKVSVGPESLLIFPNTD